MLRHTYLYVTFALSEMMSLSLFSIRNLMGWPADGLVWISSLGISSICVTTVFSTDMVIKSGAWQRSRRRCRLLGAPDFGFSLQFPCLIQPTYPSLRARWLDFSSNRKALIFPFIATAGIGMVQICIQASSTASRRRSMRGASQKILIISVLFSSSFHHKYGFRSSKWKGT